MKAFVNSFKFALNGFYHLVKTERNFIIHLLAFLGAVVAGFYFKISLFDWLVVLVISALVLSLEMINSAIEKLCDLYSTENDIRIKIIKDIAAGAVLIASIFALVIAVIIFQKYFK